MGTFGHLVKRLNMGMSFIQLWSGMKIELKVPHMNYACTFDVIGIAPGQTTWTVFAIYFIIYKAGECMEK